MSLLLLDTTFLIDAEHDESSLDDVIGDDDDVAVSAISVAELTVGVELSTGKRKRERQAFVDDLIAVVPVIPYDVIVVGFHADLLSAVRRAGRPRGAHDLIIAATAYATGREVVSADPRAFEALPGITLRRRRG
ncbi:MAG: PIN domain-containing protein [Acidimicrobiia bacterium]|nr:PIN domain-containing protein [Acidimicrobiia bacterium]